MRGWRLCGHQPIWDFLKRSVGEGVVTVVLGMALPAWATNQLELGVLQSQYLSGIQNNTQTNSYSSLGLSLSLVREPVKSPWTSGVDVMGLASFDGTEQAYFGAPQLYVGWKNPQMRGLSVTLGRRLNGWSRFDQEWKLGIWQPLLRWDYLHPKEQGLTGAFFTMAGERVEVTGFVTGVFLPDQGPQFDVENGEFHSSNRWFRQPESRHKVFNQDRRLNYELEKPKAEDLIFHSGFGLSVLIGQEQDGFWLRTSVADKPINQLHLGIEGYHSIARPNRFLESVAIVHPRVARHSVATVETGYQNERGGGWVSLTEESPHGVGLPEDWEEASLYPTRFFGVGYMHRLPWEGLRRHWFKYGYMDVDEETPKTPLAERADTLESSLDRYPYQRVVSFEWTAPLIQRAHRQMDLSIRYLYSLPEKGALLSARLDWLWNKRTLWNLGVDVLGAQTNPGDERAGLMSLYRNNDRVMAGVSYVF